MKKIILLILDGYGINQDTYGNAISMAKTPNYDKYISSFPYAELDASGETVGLPKGQMGNSEVGHLTIGTSNIVKQNLAIINDSIKSKEFFKNKQLLDIINHVNNYNSTLHIIGMLSNGAVHCSMNHLYAVMALAKMQNVKNICYHLITDGVDTLSNNAIKYLEEFTTQLNKLNIGHVATIMGRYYAMDKDNKWDRTKKAYDAIVYGIGNHFRTAEECIITHYQNNIKDEFINPSIISINGNIKDNDGILFLNFRSSRMKQLIDAFTEENFKIFNTKKFNNLKFCSLFNIHENVDYAYDFQKELYSFGEYLDSIDYKQIRIAETEKFDHITYFFDGYKELNSKNISKVLVPSPSVSTYDKKPEMGIIDVTNETLNAMEEDYDFILTNFANADMVGHTGNLEATIRAIEICDYCLGKIFEKAEESFYELVITSDHGNAESMLTKDGNPISSHTTNKVPFIICNNAYKIKNTGSLIDVVPTLIDIYEIKKADSMQGESLIIKEDINEQ